MAEPAPKFDARLEEGVRYFEQMLQLMPDDRTTLEFLVVAYEQLIVAKLAQVVLDRLPALAELLDAAAVQRPAQVPHDATS